MVFLKWAIILLFIIIMDAFDVPFVKSKLRFNPGSDWVAKCECALFIGETFACLYFKLYKMLYHKSRLRGMALRCSGRHLNDSENENVATIWLKTYSIRFYRGSKYACLRSSITLSVQVNTRAFNTSTSSLNQYQKSKVNSSVYKNVTDKTQNDTTISPATTRGRGFSAGIGNMFGAAITGTCTIIGAIIAAVGACRRRQSQQP